MNNANYCIKVEKLLDCVSNLICNLTENNFQLNENSMNKELHQYIISNNILEENILKLYSKEDVMEKSINCSSVINSSTNNFSGALILKELEPLLIKENQKFIKKLSFARKVRERNIKKYQKNLDKIKNKVNSINKNYDLRHKKD